jgi:hypothetical protein
VHGEPQTSDTPTSKLWFNNVENYVKGIHVPWKSRFYPGLASILILMSELTTQKAPDINALRRAVKHRFEVLHVKYVLPGLVLLWSSVLNARLIFDLTAKRYKGIWNAGVGMITCTLSHNCRWRQMTGVTLHISFISRSPSSRPQVLRSSSASYGPDWLESCSTTASPNGDQIFRSPSADLNHFRSFRPSDEPLPCPGAWARQGRAFDEVRCMLSWRRLAVFTRQRGRIEQLCSAHLAAHQCDLANDDVVSRSRRSVPVGAHNCIFRSTFPSAPLATSVSASTEQKTVP